MPRYLSGVCKWELSLNFVTDMVARSPPPMQLSVRQWTTVCSAVQFGGRSHTLSYALAGSYELDWILDLAVGPSEAIHLAGFVFDCAFTILAPFL
jgi:hypothetical protein